jgi:hypothetical protein
MTSADRDAVLGAIQRVEAKLRTQFAAVYPKSALTVVREVAGAVQGELQARRLGNTVCLAFANGNCAQVRRDLNETAALMASGNQTSAENALNSAVADIFGVRRGRAGVPSIDAPLH